MGVRGELNDSSFFPGFKAQITPAAIFPVYIQYVCVGGQKNGNSEPLYRIKANFKKLFCSKLDPILWDLCGISSQNWMEISGTSFASSHAMKYS